MWKIGGVCGADNCSNGIQDEYEEGVDCGGPCPACTSTTTTTTTSTTTTLTDDQLLEMYSPVLYLHPDEEYYPMDVHSITAWSNLSRWSTYSGNYPGFFVEILEEHPVTFQNLEGRDSQTFMDMINARPGFTDYQVPDESDFFESSTGEPIFPFTVYSRVARNFPGYIVIQYWFFYPYNNGLNKHEGDWEMIQVLLNSSNYDPLIATYSYHYLGDVYEWENLNKQGNTHPLVFVAKGGHGAWNTHGMHSILELECLINDETSSLGIQMTEDDYDLEIFGSQSWLDFPGSWGQVITPADIGFNGPPGPAMQEDKWYDPIGWGYNPNPAILEICSGSPINLHTYNSLGRHVGLNDTNEPEIEIPGTYFFIPSDNESELITILTEEDLLHVIESTGRGEFNLSYHKYIRSTSTDIILVYNSTQIIEDTVAYLNITSTNPAFILLIDYDGDGLIDYTKIPENFTCTGNCVTIDVDSDLDGFSDFVDNCLSDWNPNQLDNDGDGTGDMCDSDDDNDNNNDSIDTCPLLAGCPQYNGCPIGVTWLPPLSIKEEFKQGSTIPIKFNVTNCSADFVIDYNVTLNVSSVVNSSVWKFFSYGIGDESIRIDTGDELYITNFHSKGSSLGEYNIYITISNVLVIEGFSLVNHENTS